MTDRQPRKFTSAPGERASVPLWIGLYGVSGGGKTYSAGLLAEGIKSVVGGEIGWGDTENGRALHYADEFKFRHYRFDPPFEPLAYLDLLEQMHADGITVAIIDSASHEHEGVGGVLEMHEDECDRLVKAWKSTRDKVQISAWAGPKTAHRKMIQGAQRLPMHIIWCFRAKEKLEVRPGKQPLNKGFMPIGAEDLVYEMTMTALLLPGAYGRPTWQSDEIGERAMIKLPHWARKMLKDDGKPLDRELGARLAKWAQGTDTTTPEERQAEGDEQRHRDAAARSEFVHLYKTLTPEERTGLGISKAIASLDDLGNLALDRVEKGVAIMRAFADKRAKSS
jgi:hypothetical protein